MTGGELARLCNTLVNAIYDAPWPSAARMPWYQVGWINAVSVLAVDIAPESRDHVLEMASSAYIDAMRELAGTP